MALTLDRKSFIDILGQGEGEIGGALMPPPDGVWGMPPEMVETLPGYTGDVQKNRDEARALIQKAGYGPDKRLADQDLHAQPGRLPGSGGDPNRPAEGDRYRRRARNCRDRTVGAQADA